MEESDKLLLVQLQRVGINAPPEITTFSQINFEILTQIGIQFLEKLKVPLSKALSSNQKFRVATKLAEDINQHTGLRLDVNSLMVPTANDVRKIIVKILSKLVDTVADPDVIKTIDERIEIQKTDLKKELFKNWLQEEWVHPCLIDQKNSFKFRTFDTNVQLEGKSLRRSLLLANFDTQEIKNNFFPSLVRVIDNAKQRLDESVKVKQQLVMRGTNEKDRAAAIHQEQINDMKDKNFKEIEGWKNKKKLDKLINIIYNPVVEEEEVAPSNDHKGNERKPLEDTLFTNQIMFQEDQPEKVEEPEEEEEEEIVVTPQQQQTTKVEEPVKEVVVVEEKREEVKVVEKVEVKEVTHHQQQQAPKPIEKKKPAPRQQKNKAKDPNLELENIRQKNSAEIQELQGQLEAWVKRMEKYEKKRAGLEEGIQKKNEEFEVSREKNVEISKKVKQLEQLTKQLEVKDGNKGLKNEIKALEQDIENTEQEWNKEKEKIEADIEQFRNQVNEKKEKLDQARDKANRLETDLNQLVKDTRIGYDKKEQLVNEFYKMPKEGNRGIYVKRIQDVTANYQQQRQQLQKVIKEAQEHAENIEVQIASLQRYYVEFENSYNADSKKNESLSKQILKIYQEYRQIFENTIDNLKDIGKKKVDVRQLEVRVDMLSAKQHRQGIEKLKADLVEIKKETQQLYKEQ